MLIDFHTHIFPEEIAPRTIPMLAEKCQGPAYTDGMAEGLIKSMNEAGVTTSIVLPVVTKPSQFNSINRFAAQINEKYGPQASVKNAPEDRRFGRLLSFGGIHPECEDYKGCLKEIASLGLRGIKIHPDYQGTFIDDIRYMRIIEYASELGLIIVTHAGVDVGIPEPVRCTPRRAREVIDKVQPERFVLAHMGALAQWNQVEEYLVGENVWMDTAYVLPVMEEQQFERMVRNHGTDRILFATDSPWKEQKACVNRLQEMNFTEREQQMIFSENACRLLEM